jgi:uncharacterized iron-regulated protein
VAKYALRNACVAIVLCVLPLWVCAQTSQFLCVSKRVIAIHVQDSAPSRTASCQEMEKRLLAQVQATLSLGGIILLGEVHDNEHHHALRARLIEHLVAAQAKSALVFEHVQSQQQQQLASALGRDGNFLLDALNWTQSGWPDRQLFFPLMQAAVSSGYPLVAGSPNRDEVRAASAQQNQAALDLPAPLRESLLEELEQSHCGLVPRDAFEPMLRAQLARDRRMAEQLISSANRYGSAVLLAGNGHIRRDRGVPFQLRKLSNAPVLSVAFEEKGALATQSFTPADWTVVTPAMVREDPCLQMRKQFRQSRPLGQESPRTLL